MDRTRYQRFFHMLREEDKGYGIPGACNGYVKIEIKEGKGKLQAFAQNLREPDKGASYGVYLIKAGDITALPIRIGILAMQKNKGELVTQFDPDSIKNTGISIEKIGAFTVILERGNGFSGNLICPLAAVNDDRVDWRETFRNIPVPKKEAERKIEPVQVTEKMQEPIQKEESQVDNTDDNNDRKQDGQLEQAEIFEPARMPELIQEIESLQIPEPGIVTEPDRETENWGDSELKQAENMLTAENTYFEENTTMPVKEVIAKKIQPETAPINNIQIEGVTKNEVNMLERVKEALGRHFEEFQPFQRRRLNYRWWKVSNPVYLNNVLYVNRVKSPIFFNPLVIMAHFKHKHIIMGIYFDRQTEKEYIVCGTPAIYGIDERPFGELCRWVPKEGERPRYGGYGYWVVYIDPATGRLVTV